MLTVLCVGVTVTSADGGKCVCLSVCVDVTERYDTIRDASQSALSTARNQLLASFEKNYPVVVLNGYAQKYR